MSMTPEFMGCFRHLLNDFLWLWPWLDNNQQYSVKVMISTVVPSGNKHQVGKVMPKSALNCCSSNGHQMPVQVKVIIFQFHFL